MTPKFQAGDYVIYEIIGIKEPSIIKILSVEHGSYTYLYKNVKYILEIDKFEQGISISFNPRLMTDEEKLELL